MKRLKQQPGARTPDHPRRRKPTTTQAVLGTVRTGVPLANDVAPKWAWHYRTLLQLRERLLQDQHEQLSQAADQIEPHSMDPADSATDEFDHDLALSELSAEQNALYEVEEALKRILNGSYGVCEETSEPIPAARLRAIPWTRFSKAVEERLEKKGILTRPHLGQVRSVLGPGGANWEGAEGTEETGEAAEKSRGEEGKVIPKPTDEALGRRYIPLGKHLGRGRRTT